MTKSVLNRVSAGAAIAGAGIWLGASGIAHADTTPDVSSSSKVSHVSSSPPKKRLSADRAPAAATEASSTSAVPVVSEPTGLRKSKARVTVSADSVRLPSVHPLGSDVAAAPRVTPVAAVSTAPTATTAAAPTAAVATVAAPGQSTAVRPTAATTIATTTTSAAVPTATTSAAAVSTTTGNPVVDLLAGVLALFGLNTPQAPSNPVGALVWGVFRRVESAFGVVPVAAQPTVSEPVADGVVTGSVTFDSGLPLTYTTTADPAQGVVSVNPDGTFTFTPSQAARLAAGAPGAAGEATITVTASNGLAATDTTLIVPVAPYEKGTVIATIPVGLYPAAVVISPDGKRAYVTNSGGNTVSVIDIATNTVEATVPVGVTPSGVALSSDGRLVYVVNYTDGTVSVIDTATNAVVGNPIKAGDTPRWVAVTPDGKTAYVTNTFASTVSVIDTATNTTRGAIPVGRQVQGVAIGKTSRGVIAYVVNGFEGTVSVIDTSVNINIVGAIKVGRNPDSVAISPDGKYAYVGNSYDGTVSVIDTNTNSVVHTIAVGDEPHGMEVSPDGKYLYVADGSGRSTISVIDTASYTVLSQPAVGYNPLDVAVSSDGSLAYVTNLGGDSVSVLYTGNWVEPAIVV